MIDNATLIHDGVLAHTPQLTMLAKTWAFEGATCLGLWIPHTAEWVWRDRPVPNLPYLTSNIRFGGTATCELRVYLPTPTPTLQARLEMDASLLGNSLQLEGDLQQMTDDLIASQDQQLALYKLIQSTRGEFDVDKLLQILANEATETIGVDFTLLWLQDQPNRPTCVSNPAPPLEMIQIVQEFCEEVFTSGNEILMNDHTGAEDHNVRSLFTIPLTIRDRVMAVVCWVNRGYLGFTSPDLKLARSISVQIAASLENAILYQEVLQRAQIQTELDLARKVQTRLLPSRTPKVDGVTLYGKCLTALEVGGDFFDYVYREDGTLTLIVGDVSGKGLSAALLMSMIRTTMRSKALIQNPPSNPLSVLQQSIDELYDDFSEIGMFATAFIGQLDLRHKRLSYINAAQSPIIHYSNGQATMLDANEPPIGVLPMITSEEQSIPFDAGDVLVIATDGFSEARNNEGRLYGYDGLLACVAHHAQTDAQAIGEALIQEVHQFSAGHAQDDDQTLIVVKATA